MYPTPTPESVISSSNTPVIIIGLMLLLILFLLYFKIYLDNNIVNGVTLNIQDTIKNIFRIGNKNQVKPPRNKPTKPSGKVKPKCKSKIKPKSKCKPPAVPKPRPPPPRRPQNTGVDEVFNIDNNDFTYDEAHLLCKSLDSKLATYDQLLKAHKKGANWCNYGWSANGLALYPIQNKYWKRLQKTKTNKDRCGKPGINGGFFPDKNLKFGVNCYGSKPKPDASKIAYPDKKCNVDQALVDKYKKLIKKGLIDVRPFNKRKWSKYSERHSQYILTPKGGEDLIM
uniref:Link domain-containing protein n=1 Tax=viral metagenome TaxID=1070528 RepID=A0A6C0B3S5_9ZZZZ